MDARARVLRIHDGRATLACDEPPGCGACGSARGCGLRGLGGHGRRHLDVPAQRDGDAPLEAGESVTLSVADGDLWRVAATLYLPPLVGLIAGSVLARYVLQGGDGLAAAGALCGLMAGWLLARAWARTAPPDVLVRRVDDAGSAS
jgi:sigma-E factor negative regulatory protein RseC